MNFLKAKIYWPVFIIVLALIIFFRAFLFEGKLPIPSDTIVGLYHPFRDLYVQDYPNGIPFKNFLITDPVRQQYPWRELGIDLLKRFELPLWNPYSMAGIPLLGNLQSAVFYPLNLLFLLLPFPIAWSVLIMLAPFLAGIFLYYYLSNLNLNKWASLLGGIVFAFCGFSVAWLEWGTILHVGLWLPLILLSIDKIFLNFQSNSKFKIQNSKLQLKSQKFIWSVLFIFSLTFSLFAGHLQTFFYVFLISIVYAFAKWIQFGRRKDVFFLFMILNSLFIILTSIQWLPTIQLILESARGIDLDWQKEGWFIPWQHLAQFIAPDFFGNPTTLNYWGEWNYGEFIGYIGIIPLLMALFALIVRRDKKTLFFGILLLLSLLFALPTLLSKIPYAFNIPFISTAQPTRFLFVTDFSLAILAALGLDWLLKDRKKIWYPIILIATIIVGLWIFVFLGNHVALTENLEVANRNLRLPTILLAVSILIFVVFQFLPRGRNVTLILYCILVGLVSFDLIRFGWKFTPFTNQEYLFPSTKAIEFLQKQEGVFRIMPTDDRILPPNFSTVYRIQTIDGYDPLYLRRYGELIAASERGEPNISPPFGFNRIITPNNYDSKIIDLLGVKYILSLSDLESPKLVKVFQEGQTRIYENIDAFPRAFFVRRVKLVKNREEAIVAMFQEDFHIKDQAVFEALGPGYNTPLFAGEDLPVGTAKIVHYSENKVVIETDVSGSGFLVLTDSYYPTWRNRIIVMDDALKGALPADSLAKNGSAIFRTDYNFRGILVPKGQHTIEFYNMLF